MSLMPPKIDGLESSYITSENFRICINIAEKPLEVIENKNQRWRTLYYYVTYGSGKISDKNDPSNYELFLPKTLTDARRFVDCETILFESHSAAELIGFNTKNEHDSWEVEILNKEQTSLTCNFNSVLFCFNGTMKVNDKILTKYNFSNLSKNIEYKLELNDTSEIGLFKLIE